MTEKPGPTFLVVGGAKCGTTSLYFYLQEHPEIFVSGKDSFFFNPEAMRTAGQADRVCGEEAFRAPYSSGSARQAKASGEVASSYLYCYEEAIPGILETVGDVQIIILLRNPVERAYSDFMFRSRDGSEKRTFPDAIDDELSGAKQPFFQEYIGKGMYSDPVQTFLENFSEVKVCLFDDLKTDALGFVQEICRFLGVDDSFVPDVNQRYNASGSARSRVIQQLLFKPDGWKLKIRDALLRWLPEQKVAAMVESLRSKNMVRKAMPSAMRQRLCKLYQDDVNRLQKMLGRDLQHWLKESP